MSNQISRLSRSRSLNLATHNLNKNLKFKVFVANFILLLLFLELLVNIMRAVVFLIPQPETLEFYNLTESCQIYNFPFLVALLHPHYRILYIPYTLIISIQLSVLPIVTLLIAVLGNIFLEKTYNRKLKIGFCLIIFRFLFSICLLSIFQTRMVYFIPYLSFYAIDYIMYLYYARAFHQLLSNRRNEARVNSTFDPTLFVERSRVLFQYRITTVYTVCVVTLYLVLTSVNKVAAFLYLIAIDSCYINYITEGYIPIFQFSNYVQSIATGIFYGMLCISVLILYVYELLVFLAYLIVCISIVVKYATSLRRQKRTQNQVARILEEYHRDLPAYRD